MNFNEYQELAHKTAVYPEGNALAYLTTGLAGETGELCSKVAKRFRGDIENMTQDEFIDHVLAIKGEIGDILWFLAEISQLYGLTFDQVAEYNIRKLRDRLNRGVIKGSGDNR